MTHREAAVCIAIFVKAYPTQARDEVFQSMMAADMMKSGVPFSTMWDRAMTWVRTERFWPAISDMAYPDDSGPRVALIAPADPIPTERGLEILRAAIQ